MYSIKIYTEEKEIWEIMKLFQEYVDEEYLTMYQTEVWNRIISHAIGKGRVRLFTLMQGSEIVMASVGYMYPLRGNYYWLYLPRGPIVHRKYTKEFQEVLDVFLEMVGKHLTNKCVWIRLDPLVQIGSLYPHGSLKKAHKNFHPDNSLVLDLRLSESELLLQMKEKGRYNIRLSEKKGVKVSGFVYEKEGYKKIFGDLDLKSPLDAYVEIMQETTTRDRFSSHSKKYLNNFLQESSGHGLLLLAEFHGEVISGGIFYYDERTFYYYYGASSNNQRNLMSPYALQWSAICYAKNYTNCRHYDFLGIANSIEDSKDPLYGVTQFKTKFGGKIVRTGGTFEYVTNSFLYAFVRLVKWTLGLFK